MVNTASIAGLTTTAFWGRPRDQVRRRRHVRGALQGPADGRLTGGRLGPLSRLRPDAHRRVGPEPAAWAPEREVEGAEVLRSVIQSMVDGGIPPAAVADRVRSTPSRRTPSTSSPTPSSPRRSRSAATTSCRAARRRRPTSPDPHTGRRTPAGGASPHAGATPIRRGARAPSRCGPPVGLGAPPPRWRARRPAAAASSTDQHRHGRGRARRRSLPRRGPTATAPARCRVGLR